MVSFSCTGTLGLNERRTSDEYIDSRLSQEMSQGVQEEFDGEILVSQLMLDRFGKLASTIILPISSDVFIMTGLGKPGVCCGRRKPYISKWRMKAVYLIQSPLLKSTK
jgi:hypothetical protein